VETGSLAVEVVDFVCISTNVTILLCQGDDEDELLMTMMQIKKVRRGEREPLPMS
jgi:hypothetical protein